MILLLFITNQIIETNNLVLIQQDYLIKKTRQISTYNDVNLKQKLEGIESTDIDHRVVDINFNSWKDSNNIIYADKLAGYKRIYSESFTLYLENLSEIYLPDSMEEIRTSAFVEARNNLKKVSIPSSVTKITGSPFLGCYGIQEIILQNNSTFEFVNGALYDKKTKTLLCVFPVAADANNIIRIKNDTKIIASYAFSNLGNSTTKFKLVMDDFNNVVQIDDYGFYDANIEAFNITNNIKSIGIGAFSSFGGRLSSSHSNYVLQSANKYDLLVDLSNDLAMSINNITLGYNEWFDLSLNYKTIGANFADLYSGSTTSRLAINKLTFGNNVREIQDSSFNNLYCKQIIFDANSKLTAVGNFVFANLNNNANNLAIPDFDVVFPLSVTSIGEAIFYNSSRGKVFIDKNVSSLGTGINLNASSVNVDISSNNPYYYIKDGLVIEKATMSVISYDLDWLYDSNNNGILVIGKDIKYIQPRSLTMLMIVNQFKGIEIKNPNIIIGNGAFLNSGSANTDLITAPNTPEHTIAYIATSVWSWEFGPLQDNSNTNFGGGSWRGTINNTKVPEIPFPEPNDPPALNSTAVKLDNIPSDMNQFLPSQFINLGNAYIKKWFSILNPSINPSTYIEINSIEYSNLNGTLKIGINIYNALVNNTLADDAIYKEYEISDLQKSTKTSISQVKTNNQKVPIPDDISELNNYIDFTDTGNIINHDYQLGYEDNRIVYSKYEVVKILNQKSSNGYYDTFNDQKLHVQVKLDNYYNSSGIFLYQSQTDYQSSYQNINLDGFILEKPDYIISANKTEFNFIIILVILVLIIISLIAAIIVMSKKKRK